MFHVYVFVYAYMCGWENNFCQCCNAKQFILFHNQVVVVVLEVLVVVVVVEIGEGFKGSMIG